MLKKGDEMTSLLMIFGLCIVVMFVAVWVYNKSEDTAFHKTMGEINTVKAENKRLDGLLTSNIDTIAKANTRIQELETLKANLENIVSDLRGEVDKVQDHCAKLRESQINLQDMLSRKRPIIRPTGPIQVEIYTSKKAPASPHTKTDIPVPPASGKKPLGRGVRAVMEDQKAKAN